MVNLMNIEIKELTPTDPRVQPLFQLLDAHNLSHCPPEVCHLTQPEDLVRDDALLLGLFCNDLLCGMGGLKFRDGYAEVTRMFVMESHRGQGLATVLLSQLEHRASLRGIGLLKLETSEKFTHAIAFYLRHGFCYGEPFGEYLKQPFNSYMEKDSTIQKGVDMTNNQIQGQCFCGAIRYRLNSGIRNIVNCHCNFCRSHSGAAFSTYAALPYANLEIIQGQEQLRTYEVNEGKKHFCGHCGTPLFNLNNKFPGACMIYLGTLENSATLTPKLNVWCESQLDWIDQITSIHSCAQHLVKD